MAKVLVFDIEANGLLLDATRVWCMTISDEEGNLYSFLENQMQDGIDMLKSADIVVAHNGMGYDVPVLERLYGCTLPKCYDTLIVSRLLYPDFKNHPLGGNALEDWGRFLKFPKAKYEGGFEKYNDEMLEYNKQDVRLGLKIYQHLVKATHPWLKDAIKMEHSVAKIITKQYLNGFTADTGKIADLKALLDKKIQEERGRIDEISPPVVEIKTVVDGYEVNGMLFSKVKEAEAFGFKRRQLVKRERELKILHPLNCGSSDQILEALQNLYGWKPTKLTEKGNPALDDDVLKSIKHPLAQHIREFRLLKKRMEFVDQWESFMRNGRIHGSIITIGAPSGRMAHSDPNMAQIPKVKKPYGKECRSCFKPRDGWKLVGADASGLELRMLAHELAEFDGGAYAEVVSSRDPHEENRRLAGLSTRDQAKSFIYCVVYGGGPAKVGLITGGGRTQGDKLLRSFEKNLPAYKKFKDKIAYLFKKNKGVLYGLQKRPLPIRVDYAAINTLLQSHGAVVMKVALVLFDEEATRKFGNDNWAYCANVHDEIQVECDPSIADSIGKLLVESIRRSGEVLGLRCPLAGEYKIGNDWSETH